MKFKEYILEGFFGNKKPSPEALKLMKIVRDDFGLPDRLEFVDGQIVGKFGSNSSWWVILTKMDNKYFGLNVDKEMIETTNKSKALKWLKDQKYIEPTL